MNPLAEMWAKRESKRRQMTELRRMVADLKESQAELAPSLAEANARRKANMRQDGPNGFVMVQK